MRLLNYLLDFADDVSLCIYRVLAVNPVATRHVLSEILS